MQTKHVDAQVVRRHALAVKRINAAHLAEEMTRGPGVELMLGELARQAVAKPSVRRIQSGIGQSPPHTPRVILLTMTIMPDACRNALQRR